MMSGVLTGGCLCGAVQYRVDGPMRDVIVCHCDDCRRWHGHACAMAAARREDVSVEGEEALHWFTIPGPDPDPRARRGFCSRCGSSLFWDAPGRDTVSIAAGTLNPPTGVQTIAHIYTDLAGDYEAEASDGLPRYPRRAPAGALRMPAAE